MKTDYKCCICHRKPNENNGYIGYKGWICNNCKETRKDDIKEHYIKLEKKRKNKKKKKKLKKVNEIKKEKKVFFNKKH